MIIIIILYNYYHISIYAIEEPQPHLIAYVSVEKSPLLIFCTSDKMWTIALKNVLNIFAH